jgi:hypothetical protein
MFTDINSEDRLVQQTFADYLRDKLGWENVYAWNDETFGPAGNLGRDSQRDAVLKRDLREALARLNPNLPESAREEAFQKLTQVDYARRQGGCRRRQADARRLRRRDRAGKGQSAHRAGHSLQRAADPQDVRRRGGSPQKTQMRRARPNDPAMASSARPRGNHCFPALSTPPPCVSTFHSLPSWTSVRRSYRTSAVNAALRFSRR